MRTLTSALVFLASLHGAAAQFYQGKTITMISGASGGYDTFGRVLAQHMPKYIEGSPHIVVRNMPGAGGIRQANFFAESAIYLLAGPETR